MSNYCAGWRFDPAKSTGENACPFTTLYWDFLMRHEKFLARNQRMAMQLKNLARLTEADRLAIRDHAGQIKHDASANEGDGEKHNNIKGVIAVEDGAIAQYTKIIKLCDGVDYVTQDMVIGILGGEEDHRREFIGFLKEYEKN